MSFTISDLPQDCWNEIYSYIPKRCYPDLLCVSKHFSKTIDLLSATEAKVYNAFLLFLKIPTLPSNISFKAANLFDLKLQAEKLEINLAKLLSTLDIKILEDSCRNQSFYPDTAWIFYLSTLFQKKDCSIEEFRFLIRSGQLATVVEVTSGKFELPEENFLQFKHIAKQLSRDEKNVFIHNISSSLFLGKGVVEINATMDESEQLISLHTLMKEGKMEDSLKVYDSLLSRNPISRFSDLCEIGTLFAKEGNWEGIQKVLSRIDSLANAIRPEFLNWNIRKKIIIFYQSINFEKISETLWESILDEPAFELFIFERLLTLDDENKIINYFKKCRNHLAKDLLLHHGKFSLARKLNVDEREIIIAELKLGAIPHANHLKVQLLQNCYENASLIRKLAVAYAARDDFENARSLAEAIDASEYDDTEFPPFRSCLASKESFFITLFERDRAFMEIAILLAVRKSFSEANQARFKIFDNRVQEYTLGKIAGYAAAVGNYEYLFYYKSISTDMVKEDQLFEFATKDSFDPKTFLESPLSEVQKLTILKFLIPFLIDKGKLEKTVDLYHFAKKSLPTYIFLEKFCIACAEKGYHDLAALNAANILHLYYRTLFTIKSNK